MMTPKGVIYTSTGCQPCVIIRAGEMVSETPKPAGEEHNVRQGVE